MPLSSYHPLIQNIAKEMPQGQLRRRQTHMLFALAFLAAGLRIGASRHVTLPDVSAFLDANKCVQILLHNSVHCTWTVHTSRGTTKEETDFTVETIVEALEAVRVSSTSHTGSQFDNTHISILESHATNTSTVLSATSPGGRALTVIGFDPHFHTSPEGMLCAEMLLANKRVNVLLPFQEAIELNYVRKHNTEALERFYRGAAFLVPPTDTVNIFHDKQLFAEWMVSSNLRHLLPTVYKSKKEAVYPAVIKATTNTGGRNVVVVHSRDELEEVIRQLDHQPYIIEEAITGKIEVSGYVTIS